jgi:AraC family transcriptional regulator
MISQELHIKNMVCNRCIKVVKEALESLNLEITHIDLGLATVNGKEINITGIKNILDKAGFELIEDKKYRIVDNVKSIIVDLIHRKGLEGLNRNLSDYIAERAGKDYNYLSSLFSSYENITIERFIILQKIEKAKELLVYDELNIGEIADSLAYSSMAHLSRQFKQVSGFTPTEFKRLKTHKRKTLDSLTS